MKCNFEVLVLAMQLSFYKATKKHLMYEEIKFIVQYILKYIIEKT